MAEQSCERVFAPAYIWDFFCDGAACGSRCCGGWRIPVDAASRERLETISEREEIFAHLEQQDTGWATRHGENGNCSFLDADGLCLLQKKYGEEYLPDICYSYPRVSYRFTGFVERSLAMSCPVAARIALISEMPMRFEERTVFVRRVSASIHPPMEALAWENAIRSIQIHSISFLQERAYPLRERFWRLGRFFEALESRCGRTSPDTATLDCCVADVEEDAEPVVRAEPMRRLRYVASLLDAIYEAHYPPERIEALAACVSTVEADVEADLHVRNGHILENLAVNEFFLRLYPFACGGGFSTNFKLFALRFRIAEFSLLLAAAAKNITLDEDRILEMLDRIMERLDHSRASDEFLRRCAAEDFSGMTSGGFLALL